MLSSALLLIPKSSVASSQSVKLPLAGWSLALPCLALQLGFGRTKDKEVRAAAGDTRELASTSWSQVSAENKKLMGAEGRVPASHVSQQDALSRPTDGPWDHVIKYNIQYSTDHSSPGSRRLRDQMLTECNQDTSLRREAGWKW